jgi:predicted CoA-binding protein
MNQEENAIAILLANSRTIAVVGLSNRPNRPSHEVAEYMQAQGFRIIPVNPTYAGTHILGGLCHATLAEAAAAEKHAGGKIDIVDCFRRSEYVGAIVDEAIAIGARCVWMQLGVIDRAAGARAEQAGLQVIIDKCIKIEHLQHH